MEKCKINLITGHCSNRTCNYNESGVVCHNERVKDKVKLLKSVIGNQTNKDMLTYGCKVEVVPEYLDSEKYILELIESVKRNFAKAILENKEICFDMYVEIDEYTNKVMVLGEFNLISSRELRW